MDVRTLDGRTLRGTVVELSDKQLGVQTSEGLVALKTDELLSISFSGVSPSSLPEVVVELIDGTTLRGLRYSSQAGHAMLELSGRRLELPLEIVRWVQLQPGPTPDWSEWTRLAAMQPDADLLAVRKGDALDYHLGAVHDITVETVQFELGGEILPLRRAKAFGVVYRRPAAEALPPAVCQITDADGSRWQVRTLALVGATDRLRWTTPAGLEGFDALARIARIDFSSGKIMDLGELTPQSARWTPLFGMGMTPAALERFYGPRRDRDFDGQPLRLGGETYARGFAMRCRTEMVFQLPDRFRRFRAAAGVDRPGAQTRLVIHGDQRVLFDAVLTADAAPTEIDLDLSGVRRLSVMADFADRPRAGDGLLLCNPRLIK